MKSFAIQILILINLVYLENCLPGQGICGDNNSRPLNSLDCINYSNSTNLCCFLNATNGLVLFSVCASISKDDPYSSIKVGNMEYSIDCTGAPSYENYFPFNKDYSPCGSNNPLKMSDCWKYNSQNSPCCLGSTDPNFNKSSYPQCYNYPNNKLFENKNFSEFSIYGRKLYFACDSFYLDKYNLFRFSNILVFFIILFN
jgi:hypothetical protein